MALQEVGHFCLDQLPDVVLGKIISLLHWKEKEWLVMAIPALERVLYSPLAWKCFENDRAYAVEKLRVHIYFPKLLELEMDVIKRFGQFFQSCTIWIYKVSSNEDFGKDDFALLLTISRYCKHLKSLRIMHPGDISVERLKACHDRYLAPVKEMAGERKRGSFELNLCRLFYSSIDTFETGIENYMDYLKENELIRHLVCLDFSHGLVYTSRLTVVHALKHCSKLKTLKCPIQSVNTPVVLDLSRQSLLDLYLVNDDHASQVDYFEKLFLDWAKIQHCMPENKRRVFRVHYIFKNRTLGQENLVANPFVTSLICDNLSSNIPAVLLYRIADLYGGSVRTLAFCSQYWEFLMHYVDLGQIDKSFRYIATKCKKLKAFLSCLSIPSSALVCLARYSSTLATVKVFKENVRLAQADKPELVFTQKMALALGNKDWKMVRKGTNIYTIPGVDCKLLFANCFIEI